MLQGLSATGPGKLRLFTSSSASFSTAVFRSLLDHHGYVLQVVAGHVDLFAVRSVGESTQGARHHLFRVETDEIILDLAELADEPGERVQVIAVGGPGAEAVIMPREEIESFRPIAAWIGSIGTLMAGPNVDWTIREAEMDRKCELAAGERRRGSAQDILCASVEAGSIRLMGLEPAYLPGNPPALLASGMWIEAGEQPSAVVFSRESSTDGNDLWPAVDQFHLRAMACIQRSLAADASREAQRLLRSVEISRSQSKELIEQLSAVIVRRSESAPASTDAHDPLLAVCRMVGEAINAPIIRPSERRPVRQEFEDIVEIARASRLRVRRTLLRGNWWKRDVGPLVAWRGDERKPVALLPGSRRRYVMVEPGSGVTRAVNEAVAAELSIGGRNVLSEPCRRTRSRCGICSSSRCALPRPTWFGSPRVPHCWVYCLWPLLSSFKSSSIPSSLAPSWTSLHFAQLRSP